MRVSAVPCRRSVFHKKLANGFSKTQKCNFLCKTASLCMHACLCVFVCRFGPYFVEPIIAGLDVKTGKPYIATMDLIGCPMETKDFVVGGTCTEQLYGMCESLWNPDMVKDGDM